MGFVHALYCDLRFASSSARLTSIFARRGLVPDYAVSWLLPRIVGLSSPFDLLMSGRTVDAAEARQIGLVDRICEPGVLLEEAVAYAAEIVARCSPAAVATAKRMVHSHLDVDFEAALADSFATMRDALADPDAAEGIASFRERRETRFAPLPKRDDARWPRGGMT